MLGPGFKPIRSIIILMMNSMISCTLLIVIIACGLVAADKSELELDINNPDLSVMKLDDQSINGINYRSYTPYTNYYFGKISYDDQILWNSSDNDNECTRVVIHQKSDELIFMHIEYDSGNRQFSSQYIKRKNKWIRISLSDYVSHIIRLLCETTLDISLTFESDVNSRVFVDIHGSYKVVYNPPYDNVVTEITDASHSLWKAPSFYDNCKSVTIYSKPDGYKLIYINSARLKAVFHTCLEKKRGKWSEITLLSYQEKAGKFIFDELCSTKPRCIDTSLIPVIMDGSIIVKVNKPRLR